MFLRISRIPDLIKKKRRVIKYGLYADRVFQTPLGNYFEVSISIFFKNSKKK